MRKHLFALTAALAGFALVGSAAMAAPTLQVESSLSGSAFTHNKSTLKHHLNTAVSYGEDSQAVFTLVLEDGSAPDDALIDASNAKVELAEGEGYYPSEYVFSATDLTGSWEGGQYVYTLSEGDLELDLSVYPLKDVDSGREWSALNGDGAGHYLFNLKVSGLVYDGEEVEEAVFPLAISVFGFDYSGDAAGLYGEEGTQPIEPVFASLSEEAAAVEAPAVLYVGENEMPILCDRLQDDLYVVWPEGTDAAALTAQDFTLTLTSSASGKEKELVPEQDFYVNGEGNVSQLALTLINWAFVPVYDTLTVKAEGLEQTIDVASVYVFEAQQGGGGTTVDGTVTAYSFYGLKNLESWEQIMQPAIYLLSVTQEDGTVLYYAENEAGEGYLTEEMTEAWQMDASTEEYRNQQLIGNTVYVTTRQGLEPVEKEVDGETVSFEVYAPGREDAVKSGGGLLSPSACDPSLEALPGYVIPWGTENWITNEKWAWQASVDEGWHGIAIEPTTGHGEFRMAVGTEQAFTADREVERWELTGDHAEGTAVSEDGVVTIAEDETSPSFAVTAIGADGSIGAMNIKIVDASQL